MVAGGSPLRGHHGGCTIQQTSAPARTFLRPLRDDSNTLGEQVYNALLGAIIERRVKPGEPLILGDLAAQLNVSRTPVRDALSRLAAEGVVRSNGRRGFHVPVLMPADVEQIFELRLLYESFAVEKGWSKVTPEFVSLLEATIAEATRLKRIPQAASQVRSVHYDSQFHRLIVGLADNPRMVEVFDRLNIHATCALIHVGEPERLDEEAELMLSRHGRIIAALRSGDRAAAKEIVSWHVVDGRDRMLALL